MTSLETLVVACGIVAVLYGLYAIRQVVAKPAGNARMQEIAAAIQEGAGAYLNRQYTTIGIVGIVVAVILGCSGSPLLGQGDDVLGARRRGLLLAVARCSVRVEGRALVACAAAEHVAQLEEDHNRCDQEKNRAEIQEAHVVRQ